MLKQKSFIAKMIKLPVYQSATKSYALSQNQIHSCYLAPEITL